VRFDCCPDAYLFLKTVAVFVVMVAADAYDRSCEERRLMLDRVLCISRTSSLLIPVLSPAGSFCAVLPVLHDCGLCNLLGAAILRLAGGSCSTPAHHRQPYVAKTLIIVACVSPVCDL
jgi:hypothetical protein